MINLQVKRNIRLPVEKSTLERAAQLTLDAIGAAPGTSISLVIGNDALLEKLNLKYRGLDEPTDVLSFPSNEPDPDSNSAYLGDVIISLERAQEQASSGGHSLADELRLLIVHGTLHLLGYDHLEPPDTRKMQAAQDKALKLLGVNLVYRL